LKIFLSLSARKSFPHKIFRFYERICKEFRKKISFQNPYNFPGCFPHKFFQNSCSVAARVWVVKENENWICLINCVRMPLTTSIWIIRNVPYWFLVNLHIFIAFASWWCFIPQAMSQKLSHAWSLTPSLFFSIDCSILKTKLLLNPIFLFPHAHFFASLSFTVYLLTTLWDFIYWIYIQFVWKWTLFIVRHSSISFYFFCTYSYYGYV